MELDISLFAGLRCANAALPCCGEKDFHVEVPEGTSVRALRDMLGIRPDMPLLVMVNNHHEQEGFVLRNGDRVGMFPPIGGG